MTILKAYACMRNTSRKDSPFLGGNLNGRMALLRTTAALSVICGALLLLASCGSGVQGIAIEINTGVNQSIDQGQTLLLTANVGGDTRNLGVTWSIPTTDNTVCTGANCGTLTNETNFLATYTAPTNLASSLTVTVEATSIANTSVTKTITITIVLPPTFTTTGLTECFVGIFCLKNGSNGVPYSQALAATGGVAPLTYTVPANTLPAGLSLSVLGVISGTPSGPIVTQPNPVLFTVTITDDATVPLTVTQQFEFSITPAPPLSITSPSTLPSGYINGQYGGSNSTTGGVSINTVGGVPPFTWTLVSGPTSLPPGLNLGENSGQITGIPTSAAQTATPYIFTVQVQDSSLPTPGQIKQATLSIQIQAPQALAISTTSLPNGLTANGYNTSVVATGGIPPYTWSLIGGQLPAGLTFGSNGAITGTPFIVTLNPAEFTIEVQDSELNPITGGPQPMSATEDLSLTVNPGATSNNTLLTGSYSFLFNGFDSFGSVATVGTLISSGNGVITGGTEDVNRVPVSASDSGIVSSATMTGTYSLGTDGRGTMELIVTNPITKVTLTTDYQIVMESDGTVRIFENDATGTRGTAILKPVLGPANFGAGSFSGNYAFELSGQDFAAKPTAFGGVITSDGDTTLSGGFGDFNEGGSFSSGITVSGAFTTGDVNRSTASLTYQLPSKSQVTLNFAFYFVSAKDVFMIASDPTDATHPRLSGEFILQDPAIQFSKSSLAGTSVVSGTGLDGTTADVMAGLLTGTIAPNGSTSATLSYDENDGGAISNSAFPCLECATPTYSVGTNGRATFSNFSPPAGTSRLAAAYLTGPGTGFFIGNDAAVTTGLLEAQQQPLLPAVSFSASNFEGGYTLSSPSMAENQVPNVIGQVVASGAVMLPSVPSVTGILDEIDPTSPNLDQSPVISYAVAANGRGTMTSSGLVGFPVNLAFYIVSPGSARLISLDSNPGNGHPYVIFLDH
jgi:hypothetical protein